MEEKKLEVNEHVMKVTGSANLPEGLKLGHEYSLVVKTDCYDISDRDNQNGTFNRVYKLKQTGEAAITTDFGRIIQSKGRKSKSKALYGSFYYEHERRRVAKKFEDWREQMMVLFIKHLPELIDYVQKLEPPEVEEE